MSQSSVKATVIFMLVLLSFFASATISVRSQNVEDVNQKIVKAFKLLHEGLEGAGDSDEARAIAVKLNRAFMLNNKDDAVVLVNEAYEEAASFSYKSKQARLINNLIIWSLIPLASLFTTVSITKLHKWYKEREKKLLLTMVVLRRGELSDKEDQVT